MPFNKEYYDPNANMQPQPQPQRPDEEHNYYPAPPTDAPAPPTTSNYWIFSKKFLIKLVITKIY